MAQNKYKMRFERPDGKMNSQWISVSGITSVTAQKEQQAAKRRLTEELKKRYAQAKVYYPIDSQRQNPTPEKRADKGASRPKVNRKLPV